MTDMELKAYRFLGQDEVWPDANLGSDYYRTSEADKVIVHNKYKRCLAMAGLCDAKADWYYSIGENFRDCVQFNIKWRDKWLELAEKFKEAK